MDRDILYKVFKNTLSNMTLKEFAHLFINEPQAIEEFYKLCNGVKAGNTISLLFNPHRLSIDNEKDDISVFESLQYDEKLSGLARLYLYNLENKVASPFYCAIQRGYQNIQYINEFPPYVAREIYLNYTNDKSSLRVLDPCAGWGGRMIGCASIPNTTYVAFEPCTQTYEGLLKLGEWLQILQPSFNYNIYKQPYEEAIINDEFDVALTSPPYYNTEHYSDEPTNSMNKFTTFESWIDGFYTHLILDTVDRLKQDSIFVLNVGDRRYPLSDELQRICNEHSLNCVRIHDFLGGNGSNKEKFFAISKTKLMGTVKTVSLF